MFAIINSGLEVDSVCRERERERERELISSFTEGTVNS